MLSGRCNSCGSPIQLSGSSCHSCSNASRGVREGNYIFLFASKSPLFRKAFLVFLFAPIASLWLPYAMGAADATKVTFVILCLWWLGSHYLFKRLSNRPAFFGGNTIHESSSPGLALFSDAICLAMHFFQYFFVLRSVV
jgi:hypothetical protein